MKRLVWRMLHEKVSVAEGYDARYDFGAVFLRLGTHDVVADVDAQGPDACVSRSPVDIIVEVLSRDGSNVRRGKSEQTQS